MVIDRVLLHVSHGVERVRRVVEPDAVYFLEADGHDTLVRLRSSRRLRDLRPLAEVVALFEPFGFLQIHRSYAVNLRRVQEIRSREDGQDLEVRLEPPVNRLLPVSRSARPRIEAVFERGG